MAADDLSVLGWQADRDGQAVRFAEMYAASQLKEDNDNKPYVLAERDGRSRASVATMTEMAVKQETVNTIWWGYYILLKVSNRMRAKAYIAASCNLERAH